MREDDAMSQSRRWSRRELLALGGGAALAGLGTGRGGSAMPAREALTPIANPRESSLAAALRAGQTFEPPPALPPLGSAMARSLPGEIPDLRRRLVFEYYTWWGRDPWVHWDQWSRRPPHDVGATSMPRLGPYDSRDFATLESHARWIAECGAGAINISWWGPGSYEDRAVHGIMDVMRDHDIAVTFHLEPYTGTRGERFVDDVLYLLREYGDKRGWDAFLLLPSPAGGIGPVLKGFRMVLPQFETDCHGVTNGVPDYTPDSLWNSELDRLRRLVRNDFDGLTVLADTLDLPRAVWGGFDGVAIYDNFIEPGTYAGYARRATELGLVFSFNVNPGFDSIEPRELPRDSCHADRPFHPEGDPVDWSTAYGREAAALRVQERIRSSWEASVATQTDPRLLNAQRGFFLLYLNSFNEWHEGHAFEPARDWDQLLPEERAYGYHNAARGDYRYQTLRELMRRGIALPSGTAAAAT
jgi:hypothetical protein